MTELHDSPRLLLCCVLGSLLATCGDRSNGAAQAPANVLLITLDTCRADRLKSYGNDRILTPALDRLAAEGAVFEQAFSPVPSTLPSHCSIMTGTYPSRHGVHDNGIYRLEDETETLAELLVERGYQTGAFVSAFVLDRQFNLSQGFDAYDDRMEDPLARGDLERIKNHPNLTPEQKIWFTMTASPYMRAAPSVTGAAEEWLDTLEEDSPFFLWLHYFDPHNPYQPPGKWSTEYDPDYQGAMDGDSATFHRVARQQRWRSNTVPRAEIDHMLALYDGEISFLDASIARIRKFLEDSGRFENTLVIVVADHGEGFGEHGLIFEHNTEIFDETVHVPLIVRRPDGTGAGSRVGGLVRTVDVAPTVLDWLSQSAPDSMEGVSLLPLTEDPTAAAPGIALMQARREKQVHEDGQEPLLGLRTLDHKLILTLDLEGNVVRRSLYDLRADPGEKHPLTGPAAQVGAALERRLLDLDKSSRGGRTELPLRQLSDLDSDALRKLGYLGSDESENSEDH